MSKFRSIACFAAITVVFVHVPTAAFADQGAAKATRAEIESEAVINYCRNISDKAADARVARQTAALKEMEARIESKIKELDQHRDELKGWIEKQKALREAAETSLVEIYSTMDPDAAANQMTKLDQRIASSVLQQLKPRLASGILNVMPPEQAVKLIALLAAPTARETKMK